MDEDKKSENFYVFEKSVESNKETLDAIGKSIEGERQKAGIIIGFIVLALIESLDYIEKVDFLWMKISITSFFLLATILSLVSFVSVKMKNGIDTQGNFKRDWNSKEKFLLFQHEILLQNIENQKKHLRKAKEAVKFSVMSIFILTLLLILSIFL
jgi:hypothetical protein